MRVSTTPAASWIHVATRALAVGMFLLPAARVQAGEITGLTWHSGVASVAGEFIVPPSVPNNDNIAGMSPNLIQVLQKNYVGIGPVDLVFDVINTGGTTEYRFNEGVANNTGMAWSGYHLELGFGFGAGFVKATPGGGLDFDAPDYDSPVYLGSFFPSPVATELDVISTGFMPNGAFNGGMVFHIDLPDGITEFTLRQSPIPVPEPAAMSLLVMGLVALRRRTRPAQSRAAE